MYTGGEGKAWDRKSHDLSHDLSHDQNELHMSDDYSKVRFSQKKVCCLSVFTDRVDGYGCNA